MRFLQVILLTAGLSAISVCSDAQVIETPQQLDSIHTIVSAMGKGLAPEDYRRLLRCPYA